MKIYKELKFKIVVLCEDDVCSQSPGGIEFGKDENGGDLGWEG